MRIKDLKVEYLKSPEAIDSKKPRFGWRVEIENGDSSKNAVLFQKSYRIIAATSPDLLEREEADLWDSGFVDSYENTQIYYDGKELCDRQDCYWKVKLRDIDGYESDWSETSHWRMGITEWEGKFIYYDRELNEEEGELAPPVAFGKKVDVEEGLRRATLYITSLGIFNVYIDGKEYSETILAPEWTAFFKRSQYRALDVTEYLSVGCNDLVVMLSNGWYSGIWQFWPPKPYPYGKRPELCAQIELEYSDGHRVIMGSASDWKASEKLPVTFAGIYEGENIDARISVPRCDEMVLPVSVRDESPVMRCAQKNEPIAISRTIKAKSVSEVKDGVFVVDFGENIAGRIRMRLFGKCGQQIKIFHNEVLDADGTVYKDNLVVAHFVEGVDRQIVRYICRGDEDGEICRPTFTYMGFRYLEITGLDKIPSADDIIAEVFGSDIESTGYFTCSDKDINQLQANIIRSSRANFMGVPTDCPQRDERCGYTGDMQFFMPTALHNFGMEAFLSKWLVDLCADSQLEDGSYTDHAPRFGVWSDNVAWGDAGIICPYLAWKEYGDRENIRRHFDSMERYLEYLCRTSNGDFTRGPNYCGNGDWLHSGGGASAEIIATTYFAYAALMMEDMSAAIGREDRREYYHDLASNIKKALADNYINPDGSIIGAGVTGYTLVFTMNLLPDDEKIRRGAAEAFAKAVEEADCRITTGFIGTPRLLIALHMIGRDDLAERLLMRRDCPSWLYPVSVGATTIWERFDSWTEEKGFADSNMNSFNHFAFGSVGDYFYDAILGISRPGYGSCNTDNISPIEGYGDDHVVYISPVYLASLESASGSRRIYGSEVSVDWKRHDDGKITLKVKIGPNLTAAVKFGDKEHICLCGEYVFEE